MQHIAGSGKGKGRLARPAGPVLYCGSRTASGRQGVGDERYDRGAPRVTTLAEIEALLARVGIGDRVAFDRLYDLTAAKLFGICLRVLDNRGEAEEALQEVYVKVWRGAHRYRVNGLSPMTWLITIARNSAIDRLRARRGARRADKPLEAVAERLADPAPGPEAQAVAAGERARLLGCLGALPPDRAEAVRLAYLAGASYAELAARYSVPLNTMRTWLRRSLMKLRECLSQ